MIKSGANKIDQARIARMAKGDIDDGIKPMSAEGISKALRIELTCVKSFMPKRTRKPKAD